MGFAIFAGNAYFAKLLEYCGLKPGILAFSQVEMATMGLYSTLYTIPALLWKNLRYLAVGTAAPVLVLLIGLLARWKKREWLEYVIESRPLKMFDRHNTAILKFLLVLFVCGAGFLAGDRGGARDARYLQYRRMHSNTCFNVNGRDYRGLVVAQDQNRTILMHRDRVSIVKNDDMSFVRTCLKPGSR